MRGLFLGGATSGAFYAVFRLCGDIVTARSAGYLVLVLSQLVYLFECRSRGFALTGNPYLVGAALASAVITLLSVYLPPLQPVFATAAVGAGLLIPVGLGIFAPPLLFFLLRRLWRARRRAA